MLKARWVRFVAAVVLAMWSPGTMLCCCAAHAEAASDADSCAVTVEVAAHSCCASPENQPVRTAPPASHGGCGDRDPLERSCGCAHGPVNATAPAVTALPAPAKHGLADLDLLVQLAPPLAMHQLPTRPGACCRGAPHGPPASPSLLALGCMLTV